MGYLNLCSILTGILVFSTSPYMSFSVKNSRPKMGAGTYLEQGVDSFSEDCVYDFIM